MKVGFLIPGIILFILFFLGLPMFPLQFWNPLYYMVMLPFFVSAIIFIYFAFKKDSTKDSTKK